MTIAHAERLKRELTDKYVVVREGTPELRRFQGLTGTVKSVNMSGRALVQFDGAVDIGWYDIDPGYLTVIPQPLPKKAAAHAEKPAKESPKPAAKPAGGGGSPLDQIRKGTAAPAASPAPAGGKPSPLDLIRKQGATKPAGEPPAAPVAEAAPPAAEAAPSPPPAKKPVENTGGLSPLDLIRKQGAAKR
jgi:hypothetical protein